MAHTLFRRHMFGVQSLKGYVCALVSERVLAQQHSSRWQCAAGAGNSPCGLVYDLGFFFGSVGRKQHVHMRLQRSPANRLRNSTHRRQLHTPSLYSNGNAIWARLFIFFFYKAGAFNHSQFNKFQIATRCHNRRRAVLFEWHHHHYIYYFLSLSHTFAHINRIPTPLLLDSFVIRA